jgi:hypothetical protein
MLRFSWMRRSFWLLAMVAAVAGAQSSLGELRRQMTRAELEAALTSYEKLAASTSDRKVQEQAMADAAAIRERLRTGDFYPGDRIVIRVLNDTTVSDTFTVKQGRMIDFSSIPHLSLAGVLDSELHGHVREHISRYIREPDVEVIPLVRLQLSGGITQPGTDILRAGKVLVDRGATARALRTGKTIGDLGLRDGDEVRMAERFVAQTNRFWTILPIVTSLLFTIRWIAVRN